MEAADEVGEDQYWIYTGGNEVPEDVTHVRVSDGVAVLRWTFSRRERLVAVELNEGLDELGHDAFYLCKSLECVHIPSSVTTIGYNAFAECHELNRVECPEDSRIGAIGGRVFAGCKSLTEIKLPRSLSSLGGCAFRSCSRLKRVDLADTTIAAIDDYTFYECSSLDDVRLPNTITKIGKSAFHNCTSLSTIDLHDGIKTIDCRAFQGCKNLSIAKLPSTVETIRHGAFESCKLRHFISPLHCKDLHLCAFNSCKELKSIQIVGDDTMPMNQSGNGCVDIPSLLRLNVPSSLDDKFGGPFLPGHFLSNISIAPNSTMTEEDYNFMFHEFQHEGCTLDQTRVRFKRLPLHEICFDFSNEHTETTFEHVRKCLEENAGAVIEKDCIGMTPLHIIACSTNHDVRLFQKLISRCQKALLDRDIFGRTALDYALLSDAPEEVFYLMFEPFVKMGELPLNLELINAAVEHSVPDLQTWEVFSDYLERFFPALDLDWEDLFAQKAHQNSEMPIETYRWFAGKAAKQRMIKMNTMTLTRQSKD